MKAMLLNRIVDLTETRTPLQLVHRPDPIPDQREILIKISACGVCHTELDEIEGRTPPSRFPVVPGHQVIGRVAALGRDARRFDIGDRVGVAWIFSACGICRFCAAGNENLCPSFKGTGQDADGKALKHLRAGGRLVINAIRKEDIDKNYLQKLEYPECLWLEKEIKSVANVARQDVSEFLSLAAEIPIKPEVQEYSLESANHALMELKERKIRGAKVLMID